MEKQKRVLECWRLEAGGRPCAVSATQDCVRVIGNDPHRCIAEVFIQDWPDKETMNCQRYGYSYEEAKAIAKILVAAPEMLEALKTLVHYCISCGMDRVDGDAIQEYLRVAKATISKAEE